LENINQNIKKSSRFSFCYGNIRNIEIVNDLVRKSDIVIHFAAESHVARSILDNSIFFETDVLGTQVIANAVLKNINTVERFIHISTDEVYGDLKNSKNPLVNFDINTYFYIGITLLAIVLIYVLLSTIFD
jgi:dTDP-glucose 4,6-dehydratase